MILPNATIALAEERKVRDYLLNPAHPDNGGKAAFFEAMGFVSSDWAALAGALCDHACASAVVNSESSPHGDKYLVDGEIRTPSGRTPRIRSVWIVDRGESRPRLVTAYPRG